MLHCPLLLLILVVLVIRLRCHLLLRRWWHRPPRSPACGTVAKCGIVLECADHTSPSIHDYKTMAMALRASCRRFVCAVLKKKHCRVNISNLIGEDDDQLTVPMARSIDTTLTMEKRELRPSAHASGFLIEFHIGLPNFIEVVSI